jgi:DNA-binding NarL/FixJ family response regulator
MRTSTILIADDHLLVRKGLRSLLETESSWKVVAEASNGREALVKAKQFRPDLAILDISMPELNGLGASRLILKALPQTRVLILTMHNAEYLVERMLKAGARGYVLKSDAERDLFAAVEAVLRNKTFFTPAASEPALNLLRRGTGNNVTQTLTTRETEVVQLIAEGKSNKEVAAILGVSKRTVEHHRANIMVKLRLHSSTQLVLFAVRNKIVAA